MSAFIGGCPGEETGISEVGERLGTARRSGLFVQTIQMCRGFVECGIVGEDGGGSGSVLVSSLNGAVHEHRVYAVGKQSGSVTLGVVIRSTVSSSAE